MVKEVAKRVESKQINLIVDEKVKVKLSREGYNPILSSSITSFSYKICRRFNFGKYFKESNDK